MSNTDNQVSTPTPETHNAWSWSRIMKGRSFGDIFRVRSWDSHPSSRVRLSFGLGKQSKDEKTVAIMVCLGEIGIDEPLDYERLDKLMEQIGYRRYRDRI